MEVGIAEVDGQIILGDAVNIRELCSTASHSRETAMQMFLFNPGIWLVTSELAVP